MLTIRVPGIESFDNENQEFVTIGDAFLELEHSLVSLSKWESEWEKPFLSSTDKTVEETLSYVKIMTLTPNVPDDVWTRLTEENYKQVTQYIERKMTATWFNETKNLPGQRKSSQLITSELIYYWMIALNIPFECQFWHLNRLLTLIRVVNVKNSPEKKMSPSEVRAKQRALNQQRRAQARSSG